MPTPGILRTIVTPDGAQTIVELLISDGSLLGESPATRIALSIRVGSFEFPHVAHSEVEALSAAMKILQRLEQDRLGGLTRTGHPFSPAQPSHRSPCLTLGTVRLSRFWDIVRAIESLQIWTLRHNPPLPYIRPRPSALPYKVRVPRIRSG
jgi:hypothetical protein